MGNVHPKTDLQTKRKYVRNTQIEIMKCADVLVERERYVLIINYIES